MAVNLNRDNNPNRFYSDRYNKIIDTFDLVLDHPFEYAIDPVKKLFNASKADPTTDRLLKKLYLLGGKDTNARQKHLKNIQQTYFAEIENDKRTPQDRLKHFSLYLREQSKKLWSFLPQVNETIEDKRMRRRNLRAMGYNEQTWHDNVVKPYLKAQDAFFKVNGIGERVRKQNKVYYTGLNGEPVDMQDGVHYGTRKEVLVYKFQSERDEQLSQEDLLDAQFQDRINDRASRMKKPFVALTNPIADSQSAMLALGQAGINAPTLISMVEGAARGATAAVSGGIATTATNFILALQDNRNNFKNFFALFAALVWAVLKGPSQTRVSELWSTNGNDQIAAKRVAKEEHYALLKKLLGDWGHAITAGFVKRSNNPFGKAAWALYAMTLLALGLLAGLGFGFVTVMSVVFITTVVPALPVSAALAIGFLLMPSSAISLGGIMYGGLVGVTKWVLNIPNIWKDFKREWKDNLIEIDELKKTYGNYGKDLTKPQSREKESALRRIIRLYLRQAELAARAVVVPSVLVGVLAIAVIGAVATAGAVFAPIQAFLTGAFALVAPVALPAVVGTVSVLAIILTFTIFITNFVFNANSAKFVLSNLANYGVIRPFIKLGEWASELGLRAARVFAPAYRADDAPRVVKRSFFQKVELFYNKPREDKWEDVNTFVNSVGVTAAFASKQIVTVAVFMVLAAFVCVNAIATGAFSAGGKDLLKKVWDKLTLGKSALSDKTALLAAVVPGTVISAGGNAGPVWRMYTKQPSYVFCNRTLEQVPARVHWGIDEEAARRGYDNNAGGDQAQEPQGEPPAAVQVQEGHDQGSTHVEPSQDPVVIAPQVTAPGPITAEAVKTATLPPPLQVPVTGAALAATRESLRHRTTNEVTDAAAQHLPNLAGGM